VPSSADAKPNAPPITASPQSKPRARTPTGTDAPLAEGAQRRPEKRDGASRTRTTTSSVRSRHSIMCLRRMSPWLRAGSKRVRQLGHEQARASTARAENGRVSSLNLPPRVPATGRVSLTRPSLVMKGSAVRVVGFDPTTSWAFSIWRAEAAGSSCKVGPMRAVQAQRPRSLARVSPSIRKYLQIFLPTRVSPPFRHHHRPPPIDGVWR